MQPLIITGEMRSGTTFLANLLNSQDEALVFSDMLLSLFSEAQALGINKIDRVLSKTEVNVLMSNIIAEGRLHNLDFSVINRDEINSWHDLFTKSLLVIKGNNKATVIGIKKTREENYIEQLLNADIKIIYCIRDPRDVLISAKNRFGSYNINRTINNWKKSVQNAQQFIHHKNFYFLRFEDLILNKEVILGELQNFLKITINGNLSQLTFGNDKKYIDNSSFGDIKQLFDPSAVYRWKKNGISPEIELVDIVLKENLENLQYEPTHLSQIKISTDTRKLLRNHKIYKLQISIKKIIKKILLSPSHI